MLCMGLQHMPPVLFALELKLFIEYNSGIMIKYDKNLYVGFGIDFIIPNIFLPLEKNRYCSFLKKTFFRN